MTTIQCPKCGNRETINRKKSFLGFQKCVCTVCNSKFDDPSTPLSKGYRITYWVVGIWFAVVLLGKLPAIIVAAAYGPGTLLTVLVEQWAFILFVGGAVWALRKDAAIRKGNLLGRQ